MQLLLTTNPGLEAIAERELRRRTADLPELDVRLQPFGLAGHVLIAGGPPFDRLWPRVRAMRSIHHVMEPITAFELPEPGPASAGPAAPEGRSDTVAGTAPAEPLEAGSDLELAAEDAPADEGHSGSPGGGSPASKATAAESAGLAAIYRRLVELEIPAMASARSFRVTTNRIGTHDFTSMDVQREAGAALNDRYGTAVDLRGYDVNVRVDVIHRTCLVAVQHTRASLSKRYERVFNPRAALKPNVAYAMLRLADPDGDLLEREGASLLDPFCGAGTILLEAAAVVPGLAVLGSDFDERCVEGAVRNAKAAGLADRLSIRQADARHMSGEYDRRFSAIVTNPPYGVRLGRKTNFTDLYRAFLKQAHRVLEPDGRVVMLVFKRRPFDRVLEELGLFETVDVHLLETGGIYPRLYVLRPRRSGG